MDWGSIGGVFGRGLVEIVLPSIGTVIAAQVVRLLNTQGKKIGLELSSAQEARIRDLVVDAVKRTEEVGRRGNLSGDQKRTAATDALLNELRPLAGELTRERVGKMIDSVLPDVRAIVEPTPLLLVPDTSPANDLHHQ